MRYFSFTLPLDEWQRWAAVLSIPSYQKTLTSVEGDKAQVVYALRYMPQSSGDWYAIDRLRRSYQNVMKGIVFNDHPAIEGDGWESTGSVFTLSGLKVFPSDARSYPVIIKWASNKKMFRRSAFTYAKRLKYERMLTYPAMMATLYVLNAKLPSKERIKIRTLVKLANDILAQSSGWPEKLSPEELHTIRSELGQRRGQQLNTEKGERVEAIKSAISTGNFTKPSGTINQTKLSKHLGVHRNTIINLLPLALAMLIVLIWIRPPALSPPLFLEHQEERSSGIAAI